MLGCLRTWAVSQGLLRLQPSTSASHHTHCPDKCVAASPVYSPLYCAAAGLLAKSADLAVKNGQTDRYASTLANAFGYAQQQQSVPQLTEAVCDSINTGGDAAKYASGTAIAQAIAQGGDSKAAVAEATATALCTGGSTAEAWSSAYAIALSQDKNGCLVLNEAKAMALSKCGNGAADAVAEAEASSSVLGFCGLLEGMFPDNELSFSGGNSGSTSTAGGSNGWGRH